MRIDLAGRHACLAGATRDAVVDAIAAALRANGCVVALAAPEPLGPVPDILVLAHPLKAVHQAAAGDRPDDIAARVGEAMAGRGAGRIVMLLGAFAAVPSRRYPEASVAAGAAFLHMRTLAMRLGPAVLVNAVGCGAIADPGGGLVAGDASMLSHVPGGRAGEIADIVHAVLFLCDPLNSYMTGQMLTVDGGWSAGYGRDF